MKQGLMA